MTLREAVGECFIAGVAGKELTTLEAAWLRLMQPGGVILFARNIVSAEQTRALLESIQSQVRQPLFCCLDLEGGLVDRLRDALAPIPSTAAVAGHASAKLSREHGRLIGEAARLFGFNVTFAPVLDLGLPESAGVMHTRTAGANAKQVIAYAAPFLDGLAKASVTGCGKHFPGLGGGTLDSHHHLPRIARSMKAMQEDLLPYRKLRRALPMVMVSHAAYPDITGRDEPASQSRFWITKTLRGELGYRGLIVSDDLEMQAVLARGIESAAMGTLAAGADIALICHKPELVLAGFEAALREAEQSRAFEKHIAASAQRIAKAKLALRPRPRYTATSESKLRSAITQFTRRIERG